VERNGGKRGAKAVEKIKTPDFVRRCNRVLTGFSITEMT
jgi:hypothetical protein